MGTIFSRVKLSGKLHRNNLNEKFDLRADTKIYVAEIENMCYNKRVMPEFVPLGSGISCFWKRRSENAI